MIRILYLLPSLRSVSPILGTLALIRHLDPARFCIAVSCLDSLDEHCSFMLEELKRLGVPVRSLNIPSWRCLTQSRSVAGLLEAEQYDIIHSHGIRSDFVNVVSASRAVSVTSVREMLAQAYLLNYGRLHAVFALRVHPCILRRMDCIIAISKAIKSSLRDCGIREEGIIHIPNFIDLSCRRYARRAKTTHLRAGDGGIHVGYAGNLSSLKRVDKIIRAFAALVQKYRDRRMTLHLAGEGPLRDSLTKLAHHLHVEDGVRFHGYVVDISDFMGQLDLVVLASETEGIPRVLMEAMSMGKTCLGPRIGGVDELIDDGRTGYLFDPDSDSDLAAKMEQIVISRRYLDPAVVAKHIAERFSAEVGARRIMDVYTSLVAGRAVRPNGPRQGTDR